MNNKLDLISVSPSRAAADFLRYAETTTGADRDYCLAMVRRIAAHREPPRKTRKPPRCGYHGVTLRTDCVIRPYAARCAEKFLGMHATAIDAARTYDAASWERFHDASRLNFPGEVKL